LLGKNRFSLAQDGKCGSRQLLFVRTRGGAENPLSSTIDYRNRLFFWKISSSGILALYGWTFMFVAQNNRKRKFTVTCLFYYLYWKPIVLRIENSLYLSPFPKFHDHWFDYHLQEKLKQTNTLGNNMENFLKTVKFYFLEKFSLFSLSVIFFLWKGNG